MPVEEPSFDYSAPLRNWTDDPTKPVSERMLSLIECYSTAYRRMVMEIRRLEAENYVLRNLPQPRRGNGDLTELQRVIDASIAILDPDRE